MFQISIWKVVISCLKIIKVLFGEFCKISFPHTFFKNILLYIPVSLDCHNVVIYVAARYFSAPRGLNKS